MPPKAVDARKRLNRNRRFRGHGALVCHGCSYKSIAPVHGRWRINRGIDKGSSPCWYATRAPRLGPPTREVGKARSYKVRTAPHGITS